MTNQRLSSLYNGWENFWKARLFKNSFWLFYLFFFYFLNFWFLFIYFVLSLKYLFFFANLRGLFNLCTNLRGLFDLCIFIIFNFGLFTKSEWVLKCFHIFLWFINDHIWVLLPEISKQSFIFKIYNFFYFPILFYLHYHTFLYFLRILLLLRA